MGVFAVESRLQRLKNVPFTRDEVFKLFMEPTHWRADARLVRAYIDKTASTIDWLESMGVEFELLDIYTFPGCLNQTGHIVKTPAGRRGGITARMFNIMRDKAVEKGVELHPATPVKKIVRNGSGFSVTEEDKSGETMHVDAKAVVITAGGYAHNKEMLKEHGGFELGRDLSVMHAVQLTGEGIQMAWELGAVPDGMCPYLASVRAGPGRQFEGSRFVGMVPVTIVMPDIAMTSGQPYLNRISGLINTGCASLTKGSAMVLISPMQSSGKRTDAATLFSMQIRRNTWRKWGRSMWDILTLPH
jgi:hypothetical protein